jgi:hypothetical protein
VGLDNVAVQWPRTGHFYEPVGPSEFAEFAMIAARVSAATATGARAAADPGGAGTPVAVADAGPDRPAHDPVAHAPLGQDRAVPQDRAVALADHIAKTGSVPATGYTQLVDLLLGLSGVLYATDASAEDEDPVIDPDGCAWIAGGLERFVAGHAAYGEEVTFASVATVMRAAVASGRLAEQQLRWLDARLGDLRDERGEPPAWRFTRTELSVLAAFYRYCSDQGFAVFADF